MLSKLSSMLREIYGTDSELVKGYCPLHGPNIKMKESVIVRRIKQGCFAGNVG
jgi:hypothetical protein